VGGQPLQEILEHGIVRSRPDGSVELQVCRRPGLVIRADECAVTFHQTFEPHDVSDVVGQGSLPGRLLFQKNPHIIDLDDFLGRCLMDLEPTGAAVQKTVVLETAKSLAHRRAGDAEAFPQGNFPQGRSRRNGAAQDFRAQLGVDRIPVVPNRFRTR
jgi:hypothetical protein